MNSNDFDGKPKQFYLTSIDNKPTEDTKESQSKDKNKKNLKPPPIPLSININIPNKFNDTFLNFFIEKESSFGDFEKILRQYQEKAISSYNYYNSNISILQMKQKEYDDIGVAMEKELLLFLMFEQQHIMNYYYTQKIEAIKMTIKIKEHELNCYREMHKRLYKANYLIEKRLEHEMKLEQLNEGQHKKYEILKNHALNTVTKQMRMLNHVRAFHHMSQTKYEEDSAQKTNKYNRLDFAVMMIKNDTIEIEKCLETKRLKQNEIRQEIKKIELSNRKYYKENISIRKEYHKITMKLISIYSILKVKSLDDIIFNYNLERKVYQTLNCQFVNANKQIAETNIELTELTNELKSIHNSIESFFPQIPIEYIDDYINARNRIYSEVSSLNTHLTNDINSKGNRIKLLAVFMINYLKKIFNSMSIPVMGFGFTLKNYLNLYEKYFVIKSNDIQFNFDQFTISNDFYHDILNMFIYLSYYIYVIMANALNIIFTDKLTDLVYGFEVFGFDGNTIYNLYENAIKTANIHLDKREKIYRRSDREILEKEKKTENKRPKAIKAEISKEKLYLSYVLYLKQKQKDNTFIKNYPRRSIALINKYTNDLVSNRKKSGKKNMYTMTYANLLTTENERMSTEIKTKPIDIDDSYKEDQPKREHSLKKKPKVYNLQSASLQEMDIIYSRMNDLRKLELHYFKAKDKHLVANIDFNETYYQFKKKFKQDKIRHRPTLSLGFNVLPQLTINDLPAKGSMTQRTRDIHTATKESRNIKSSHARTHSNVQKGPIMTNSSLYMTTLASKKH